MKNFLKLVYVVAALVSGRAMMAASSSLVVNLSDLNARKELYTTTPATIKVDNCTFVCVQNDDNLKKWYCQQAKKYIEIMRIGKQQEKYPYTTIYTMRTAYYPTTFKGYSGMPPVAHGAAWEDSDKFTAHSEKSDEIMFMGYDASANPVPLAARSLKPQAVVPAANNHVSRRLPTLSTVVTTVVKNPLQPPASDVSTVKMVLQAAEKYVADIQVRQAMWENEKNFACGGYQFTYSTWNNTKMWWHDITNTYVTMFVNDTNKDEIILQIWPDSQSVHCSIYDKVLPSGAWEHVPEEAVRTRRASAAVVTAATTQAVKKVYILVSIQDRQAIRNMPEGAMVRYGDTDYIKLGSRWKSQDHQKTLWQYVDNEGTFKTVLLIGDTVMDVIEDHIASDGTLIDKKTWKEQQQNELLARPIAQSDSGSPLPAVPTASLPAASTSAAAVTEASLAAAAAESKRQERARVVELEAQNRFAAAKRATVAVTTEPTAMQTGQAGTSTAQPIASYADAASAPHALIDVINLENEQDRKILADKETRKTIKISFLGKKFVYDTALSTDSKQVWTLDSRHTCDMTIAVDNLYECGKIDGSITRTDTQLEANVTLNNATTTDALINTYYDVVNVTYKAESTTGGACATKPIATVTKGWHPAPTSVAKLCYTALRSLGRFVVKSNS